ncbi:transcription factor bHLH18-like isoform X2 [Asparagus officinalis]|uniref:transcription factor bHLH18-like isoform X2 n=1 Tax=Asparagus officinalis TaxID=4686 RepID=UPI00098DEB45|nr:transcription factor bHLH18-like isoform X2 [Asparagus officinalis]
MVESHFYTLKLKTLVRTRSPAELEFCGLICLTAKSIATISSMELSEADLFTDAEIEDHNFNDEWELSSLNQDFSFTNIWDCFQETLSSESNNSCSPCFEAPLTPANIEEPTEKFPEPDKNWSFSSTNMGILSFGHPCSDERLKTVEAVIKVSNNAKVKRSATGNQEHVIAERKRREKISEHLFTLYKIIPGMKRKLKTLEEQAAKETVKSIFVSSEKSQPFISDDKSGDDPPSPDTHLNIEAKIAAKIVLIKIHCKNRRGMLLKALSEIEKFHLSVISSSSLPFSDQFLDITVTAQVEEGFSMTVKDLLKKLNTGFRKFMSRD